MCHPTEMMRTLVVAGAGCASRSATSPGLSTGAETVCAVGAVVASGPDSAGAAAFTISRVAIGDSSALAVFAAMVASP